MFNLKAFKKFFLYTLIVSLAVSAFVAAITVLTGIFNEITGRIFSMLAMIVVHSLISLSFIWDDSKQEAFEKLTFFINTIFGLIVLSFFTSIFGIWKILATPMVINLYQSYFLTAFASLNLDIFSKMLNKDKNLDTIVYANYPLILIIFLMLHGAIYIENSIVILGEVYFRILGAVAIFYGTLSILAAIFYKMYMSKHPEEEKASLNYENENVPSSPKKISIWVWVFLGWVFIQIFGLFRYYLIEKPNSSANNPYLRTY